MKKIWNKQTGECVELWPVDAREVISKQGGTWTDDPAWESKAGDAVMESFGVFEDGPEDDVDSDNGETLEPTMKRGRRKCNV